MTLTDLIQAVDRLSPEDRQQLRDYLEQQERKQRAEEKIRRLNKGFAALREGLSEKELKAISQAMNEEHIEPFDESEWAV